MHVSSCFNRSAARAAGQKCAFLLVQNDHAAQAKQLVRDWDVQGTSVLVEDAAAMPSRECDFLLEMSLFVKEESCGRCFIILTPGNKTVRCGSVTPVHLR